MNDEKTGVAPQVPFRLGVVAAISGIAGIGIALTEEGFYNGSPLSTLAYILMAIGVLAAIAGALWATFNVASRAMGRVKLVAASVARPKITSTSGMSTADELEKWARLRDTGVVSQQEFEAARSELLKGG